MEQYKQLLHIRLLLDSKTFSPFQGRRQKIFQGGANEKKTEN